MPINQMHMGEELLYVLIPAFVVMMIIDVVKRRKLRRQEAQDSGNEEAPADNPPGSPLP